MEIASIHDFETDLFHGAAEVPGRRPSLPKSLQILFHRNKRCVELFGEFSGPVLGFWLWVDPEIQHRPSWYPLAHTGFHCSRLWSGPSSKSSQNSILLFRDGFPGHSTHFGPIPVKKPWLYREIWWRWFWYPLAHTGFLLGPTDQFPKSLGILFEWNKSCAGSSH